MLTVVAYDITDPKRLARVAKVCEDYGVRVQYSLFECRLDEDEFADFWLKLLEEIDDDEDRMQLRRLPRRPRYIPYISLTKYVQGSKNDVWRDYLPVVPDLRD